MKELLFLLISTVFINNIVFTKLVGVEGLLEFTKNQKLSKLMAKLLVAITFLSSLINYFLYEFVLKSLSFEILDTVVYVVVIYLVSKFTFGFLKSKDMKIYEDVKIYLPFLIANTAVLYSSIAINSGLSISEALVTSVAIPLGLLFMFYLFASVKKRLDMADTPKAFRGFPILLIFAAIAVLALSGLSGLV